MFNPLAKDPVIFTGPSTNNEPVILADPVYGKAGVVGAQEADTAQLDVPNKEPVRLLITVDPLTLILPETLTIPIKVCVSNVSSPN